MLENIITGLLAALIPAVLSFPFIVGLKRPEKFQRICETYIIALNLGLLGASLFWAGFSLGSSKQLLLDREHMTASLSWEMVTPPFPGIYLALGFVTNIAFGLAAHVFQIFLIADDGGSK